MWRGNAQAWRQARRIAVRAVGLAFLIVALAAAVWQIPDLLYPSGGQPRATLQAGLLTVAAAAVALTGVWITVSATRLATNLTHKRELAAQLTERYARTVDQLGSPTLDVRLGGIYALERLAKDSKEDQPSIVEVLSAFVREHSTDPKLRHPAPVDPRVRLATDIRAAVTVLARLHSLPDVPRADLSGANLTGPASLTHLHPTTTNLVEVDLNGADLTGAVLKRTNLTGAVNGADLTDAVLKGADLTGAVLKGTNLTDAVNGADLTGAVLKGTNLTDAVLKRANLTGAVLEGADLTGAVLEGANLTDANLGGAKGLTQAQLDSARGSKTTALPRGTGLYLPAHWTRPMTVLLTLEELASAVGRQWENEAAVRRLNDPYPLPVYWQAAPADLVESWLALRQLARTGVGWTSADSNRWAAGPAELAGEGSQLVEVLDRVPTGRLVILGEPGAGKTMLAVRLVLDLLARRSRGAPVPLLVSLASWNPRQQDLHRWLEDRLFTDHPGLALPPLDGSERNRARALLDAGLILPVLDGLDEIPDRVRGLAIAQLNNALRPGQRLVLISRTGPYRAAVHSSSGVEVLLTGAAGVQLCPLDATALTDYLGGSPDSATRHRWQPVLTTLTTHPSPPVAQALSTPLMVGLAKAIYHPPPDEHTGALLAPAELLDSDRFPDRTAVEQYLFDGFIPAVYRPHPDPKRTSRWPAAQAERWLVFLAHHLQHRLHTTDLCWWEIPRATPAWVLRLAVGFLCGFLFGLTVGLAAGFAIIFTVVFTVVFVIVFGLMARFGAAPAQGVRWSPVGLKGGLGLAVGLLVGLAVGLGTEPTVGLTAGLAVGFVSGLTTVPADLMAATSPGVVLIRDRNTFWIFGLAGGLLGGLVGGLGASLGVGLWLVYGLTIGLMLGLRRAAWPSFLIARGWLAIRGRLPWALMAFLADAHQQGVLRQVGAAYQFRHAELQRRLAARP